MIRTKKQNWQFFRCFYMKGCLYRAKQNLKAIVCNKFTTMEETNKIKTILVQVDKILSEYDRNSLKVKPRS